MVHRAVARPVLLLVALYTAVNGFVHAQQWLDGYRDIPSSVPGSWVVRIGFPINAAAAALIAVALVVAVRRRTSGLPTLLGAVAFSAGTLGMLIATRVGSVFGWSEPVWTPGANQTRAVAIGALTLAVLGLLAAFMPKRETRGLEVGTTPHAA